jgi:uncharacterized protein YcfJ
MFNLFKKFNAFAVCSALLAVFSQGAIAATSPIATSGLVTNTALTGRPALAPAYSVAGVNALGRMPTLRVTPGTGTVITTPGTVTVTDKECIDSYLECAKQPDVCGPNFEDCTNNFLFFAKKSNCASILLSCPSNGIQQLFGASTTTVLATKSTTVKDENGEFVYIYPTDGSILGTMIVGASISQRLNTQDCVRKYMQCLKKDDVCGNDFELCTSDYEFRRQKVFCQSTLARCQLEGRVELWGTTDITANPQKPGRLRDEIDEGAELAAKNAVATCYKVTDNCMLQACARNPFLCKEGTGIELVNIVNDYNNIDSEGAVTSSGTETYEANRINPDVVEVSRANIRKLIENACLETVGGNRYCHATVFGSMPTASQLKDEDRKRDVFDALFSGDGSFAGRFNSAFKAKVDDLIEKFDKKQKQKCQDTIVQCAMRNCGEGVGSACYAASYANNSVDITRDKPYGEIKSGCQAIINSDMSCRFAAARFDTSAGILNYEEDGGIFTKLFTSPTATEGLRDPTGAVAALNARLANSYSVAALENMRVQCEKVADSCVRSMCGADFQNCFRNRTDIVSSIGGMPDERAASNRVAGVLDRAIVIGLCLNTMKSNQVCEEHIKVEKAKITNQTYSGTSVWGNATSVRQGWIDGATVSFDKKYEAKVQMTDENGMPLCLAVESNIADYGRCDGTDDIRDADGKVIKTYNIPFMVTANDYATKMAETQIFQRLIFGLELEAQAIYNKKVTRQMNLCHAENAGGIMGTGDMYSTFMWVRLKSKKVPADYSVKGLPDASIQASNDLYGSFCRVRVEIRSNDALIKKAIEGDLRDAKGNAVNGKAWTRTNFAVGDAFTCGSWIPQKDLEAITEIVYNERYASEMKNAGRTRGWITAAGSILGAFGGGYGMNALQKGNFGGLINTNKQSATSEKAKTCQSKIQASINSIRTYVCATENYNDPITDSEGNFVGYTYRAYSLKHGEETTNSKKNPPECPYGTVVTDGEGGAISILQGYLTNNKCGTISNVTGSGLWTDGRGKTLMNIGGAVIGAFGGGWLANQATKDIQESAAEKAATQEKKEWFDSVGSRILCYIGSEEIGVFGDVRSTSME